MNYAWKRTADATDEPISLEMAKLHLRVSTTTEDGLINDLIVGARQQIEQYLNRGLLTQTWQYVQDVFLDEWALPMAAPLQSVTSIQYYDTAGALQTVDTDIYTVDSMSEPGRIVIAPNQVWPQTQADRTNAVIVTYVVGETSAASLPQPFLSAMRLLINDRYEIRQQSLVLVGVVASEIPNGVEALLAPYRVRWAPPCGYA